MIEIDGSEGESGGQILRTALSLSAITGKPFRIINIRQKRPKPGLQAQHLTCVRAVKQITGASVSGAELHSLELSFKPGKITAGNYFFDIGTAGSITLLAQCVLPVLLFGKEKSTVHFSGGTHVSFSPVTNYFSQVFLPTIKKMGVNASIAVNRCGWFPAGGGKATLAVNPAAGINPLNLTARALEPSVSIAVVYSQLPDSVSQRIAGSATKLLSELCCCEVKVERGDGLCPGCMAFVKADYGNCVAGFSALGKKGKRAEEIGTEAALDFLQFDKTTACVDEKLADQLLLYCALANGESNFTPNLISQHFQTNAGIVSKFLPAKVETQRLSNGIFRVSVKSTK